MKKRTHARKNAQKYGRNVYGERCIVKDITIQKEAANKQCIEIVKDIRDHAAKGLKLEYTVFYAKDLTMEEIEAINVKMAMLMRLQEYYTVNVA